MQQARATAQPSAAVVRRAAPALALLILVGCGGGSGGGDAGGDALAAADLAGTWGGTVESPEADKTARLADFATLELDIGPDGDITALVVDGVTQDVKGRLKGKTDGSNRLFIYDLIVGGEVAGTGALYVAADAAHAGFLLEDGSVGVVQKGVTSGTYADGAAEGSWVGEAAFILTGLEENGVDRVSGSLSPAADGVAGEDFEFGACRGIDLTLAGFESRYGVYDSGMITSPEEEDCPDFKQPAADAYATYDGEFLLLYAGCEAGFIPAECHLTALSRKAQ